jgi:hypothetical protein
MHLSLLQRGRLSLLLAAWCLSALTVSALGASSSYATAQAEQPTSAPANVEESDVTTMFDVGETAAGYHDRPPSTMPTSQRTAPTARRVCLMPPLSGATLTWFAVVVILALSFRMRPLLSLRNFDALILAATCLLLLMRGDTSRLGLPRCYLGQTGQWWSYLLLTLAGLYWLLRGWRCLGSTKIVRCEVNVSNGALFVLMLAGLVIGVHDVATSPLTPGTCDGIVGAAYFNETGELPYAHVEGHDARSPLLYLLHAGAARVRPPVTSMADEDNFVTMTWADRAKWQDTDWWQAGDFSGARLANGLLFLLMVLGLSTIGRRLHSPGMGLTMVILFCVFPGALECLSRPEIMLPAVLLCWSLAFALIPGIGGLLSGLLIVMAGFAWPWAWLALPLFLAYFFRHGWEAIGGLVGVIGGLALGVAGLVWLAAPALPRADAALARAGLPPTYTVARGDDGTTLLVTPYVTEEKETPRGWLRWFWRFLVNSEALTLNPSVTGTGRSAVDHGDIDTRKLLFQRLVPTADTADELNRRYDAALAAQPPVTRMWVTLRTVLEQTWLSTTVAEPTEPGVWTLWSTTEHADSSRWALMRKLIKLLAGIVALLVAIVIMAGQRPQVHHLVGGLVMVICAVMLASDGGAVTNLVWLLPGVLALWAVNAGGNGGARSPQPAGLADIDSGVAPRISVER